MSGSYFAVPYQVFFEDTMAYGSHHYLTNFRFQCVGRETLLFDVLPDARPGSRAELDQLILLTREGYTRNINPVRLGERVGILMTQEERTRASVRLCFRVVREDGEPVCCGYQTIVFVDKDTYEVSPIPPGLAGFIDEHAELVERLAAPSFAERCHAGGKHVREMFTERVRAIGTRVAAERAAARLERDDERSAATAAVAAPAPRAAPLPAMSLAFVFPGQGSYDPAVLRELYLTHPDTRAYFAHADAVARRHWGHGFLPLVEAASPAAHDAHLRLCPELDQLGIFLADVVLAELLVARGARPDVLVGHSFGEVAALSAGGAFDVLAGLEIVAARVDALRDAAYGDGAMLAISVGPDRARALLAALGSSSLDVAGVNTAKQTVISGPAAEVRRVAEGLPAHGVMGTVLKSRHPFHSRMLAPAVERFAAALRGRAYRPLATPVYSPIEGGLYATAVDVPGALSRHFVTPFDFPAALAALRAAGVRQFVECGAGETLSRIVLRNVPDAPAGTALPTVPPESSVHDGLAAAAAALGLAPRTTADVPTHGPVPVAIVSTGCVLPGARDADEFWHNVNAGVGGIDDLSVLDPAMTGDFGHPGDVVPDKAYSLLAGIVRTIEPDPRLPYSADEFAGLTRAQRLLANALAQCVHGAAGALPVRAGRTHCLLGSTADGIKEYDEALAMQIVRRALASLDAPGAHKAAIAGALDGVSEMEQGDPDLLAPYPSYAAVVDRLLGAGVGTELLDAACASSLFAFDSAMKLLSAGESDLVIAGGVFSAGPGINVLFGQFRGLSAVGSFPFDARADGVIFGEGAAVLALKRLPDALAAGDRIHAVIRGIGLASDGKAASVNVPRSEGQVLATRRAYEKAGIDPNTVQYLEAHATSTTVGDATEFESLRTAFADRRAGLPPIWVESVKGLTGHTGWVAGATSVIKVARALAERRVPPQHAFVAPHPTFRLSESPFVIPTTACAWTANVDGAPRRAGINGFGFGGTNAHLILEAYDEDYHRRLAAAAPAPSPREPLVVVGAGTIFPAADGGIAEQADGAHHFDRRALRLPGKKRLLPDVTEHMDIGQYLVAMAADRALAGLGGWDAFRDRIGIALGTTAKTALGVAATSRIFVDRIARGLTRQRGETSLSDADFTRLRAELVGAITRTSQPSNPYTLIGFMPNVAAGRVANLFDLKGANVVVDAGPRSLAAALGNARRMLAAGDCDVVLAGAVQCTPATDGATAHGAHGTNGANGANGTHAALPPDGVCLLAVTTARTAAARGLTVLSTLELSDDGRVLALAPPIVRANGEAVAEVRRVALGGAAAAAVPGIAEVARALADATAGGAGVSLRFETAAPGRASRAVQAPRRSTLTRRQSGVLARLSGSLNAAAVQAAVAAAAEPVGFFTPALFASPIPSTPPRRPRRPLYLIDQPALFGRLRDAELLADRGGMVAAPAALGIAGAFPVDLTSDQTIRASLEALDVSAFDAVIALKDLGASAGDSLLDPAEPTDALLDLLFAVSRHAYAHVQRGTASLATLCVGGFAGRDVHPYSGLAAGFIKSLARELPDATCKSVVADTTDLRTALGQLAVELGAPRGEPVEVCWDGDARKIFRLVPVPGVTADTRPYVNAASVVVATGGGRGVTALCVAELLERHGCTVVLLGRTDPASVPERVLAMDAARFKAYEAEFYKEELERDRTAKPAALRRRYGTYGAGREVAEVLRGLRALPGRVEYVSTDVGDPASVDRAIARVVASYGRVDLVMHGAGVQVSVRLDSRKLDDFRRTIDTKIKGLRNLYAACRRHVAGAVHFHVLTSAFSYIGNDGQPDYGAANEAMNRLAHHMHGSGAGAHWTSLAWLAWDGIGMTRGSEYTSLVAERGLHGVTADEGRALFAALMRGRPAAAANILLTNAERRLLAVDVADGAPGARPSLLPGPATIRGPEWRLDAAEMPVVREHVVNGAPTLPGTFELALVVEAACAVRPGLHVGAVENVVLSRFVRVPEGRATLLRSVAQVLSEGPRETVVRVALLSDFIHKSGAVLQQDVVHFEADVSLTTAAVPLHGPAARWEPFPGLAALDPYMNPAAPVRLSGTFACLHDIVVAADRRRAVYRVTQPALLDSLGGVRVPPVLLDAMLRLTVADADGPGTTPVFVPERLERVRVVSGLTEAGLHAAGDVYLVAATPQLDGELLTARWVQALDASGRTLAVVEYGTARRMEGHQPREVTARPSRPRMSGAVWAMS